MHVMYKNYDMIKTKPTGNRVYIKLDPPNDHIERIPDVRIEIDTTYNPERHITRTGTVLEIPKRLSFYKTHQPIPDRAKVFDEKYMDEYRRNNPPVPYSGMDWKTEMELQIGDKVVMYYLAVDNCMKQGAYEKDYEFYHDKMNDRKEEYIWVKYQNIYVAIRDGKIIPINGFVLVEPMENTVHEHKKKEAENRKIKLIRDNKSNNTHAVYGKVAYMGKPNIEYKEGHLSDIGYDNVQVGSEIIMKKISDIPMEYEYHAKVDGGKKLYRIQRHDILCVCN